MQIPLTCEAVADVQQTDAGTREVSIDLAYRRLAMVNLGLLRQTWRAVGFSRRGGDGF
jgi:hypothetical protein